MWPKPKANLSYEGQIPKYDGNPEAHLTRTTSARPHRLRLQGLTRTRVYARSGEPLRATPTHFPTPERTIKDQLGGSSKHEYLELGSGVESIRSQPQNHPRPGFLPQGVS